MLLLLFVPEGDEREAPQRDVPLHRDPDGGVGAADLLQRQGVGYEVAAAPAILFRNRQPHQAELGHPGDDVVRKPLLLVQLRGVRFNLLLRVLVGQVPPPLLLFGKIEVHRLYPPRSNGVPLAQARFFEEAALSYASSTRSQHSSFSIALSLVHLLFVTLPFSVAEDVLLDLAGSGFGQLLAELDGIRDLEVGDALLDEVYNLLL